MVSQDQKKPEQDSVDNMNLGQVSTEEKKFDQITHQHHHASPTPPASIQVENRPDQSLVVLEQVPGAEQKPDEDPAPKEKEPEQVQVEVKEPEKVAVVSGQVPVDEPQPGQVPVENKKPEQVFFEQENPVIPVEQQNSEPAVGTETSDKTQMDPVKKQVSSTTSPVTEHTNKPNHSSPTRKDVSYLVYNPFHWKFNSRES